MKLARAVEAKVAASTTSTAVVAAVFGLAAYYHWFTPPPPYLTALLAALVSGVAGWLAPHTPRPAPPDPVVVPQGIVKVHGNVTPAQAAAIKAGMEAAAAQPPQVQPPATTTGPVPPTGGQAS